MVVKLEFEMRMRACPYGACAICIKIILLTTLTSSSNLKLHLIPMCLWVSEDVVGTETNSETFFNPRMQTFHTCARTPFGKLLNLALSRP